MSAEALLRRNLSIYGVGGLIAPFVGIKLIDMLITAWRTWPEDSYEEASDHRIL